MVNRIAMFWSSVLAMGALACSRGEFHRPADAIGAPACDARASELRIEPSGAEIEAGPDVATALRFRALATFSDGQVAEVPALWSWPSELGSLDSEGLWVANGAGGGRLTVRARARGVEATAQVGVVWVQSVSMGIDAAARERFDEPLPRDPSAVPRLLAPAPGERIDASGAPIEFLWEGSGHDVYRLRLLSATLDVSVYTTETSWTPSSALWEGLASSSRGLRPHVSLEAMTRGGSAVHGDLRTVDLLLCHRDERCDGTDDDCDGVIDDACTPADIMEADGQLACSEGA